MANTSLAARTREAAREHPFLHASLGAGIVNYTAAARYLDVDGEVDAVATALRRYADELSPPTPAEGDVRVTMERGVGAVAGTSAAGASVDGDEDARDSDGGRDDAPGDAEPLLQVGDAALAPDAGSLTAVVARGAVDADALRSVLGRLATADVDVVAAGVAGDALLAVVERRAGADALRAVEGALEA